MPHRIGVCSWSLRPASAAELVERVQRCGLNAIQLALDPIRRADWPEQDAFDRLRRANIAILSGMMAPAGEDYSTIESVRITGGVRSDELWPANISAAHDNAKLAQRFGLRLVTVHAGFLAFDRSDPQRTVMLERLQRIVEAFAACDVAVAFETGQDTAETLIKVLQDLKRAGVTAGVNFDPANMILYGMGEPVAALRRLTPWIKQIHIKDAKPTEMPGTWGTETVVGQGAVNWSEFFNVIERDLPNVNLLIEREARQERIDDIRAAHQLIRAHLQPQVEAVHD